MKMDKQVQIRMPLDMYQHLQKLAAERAPGTTPALLIREAIYRTYPLTYPVEEITALQAAEEPKKAATS